MMRILTIPRLRKKRGRTNVRRLALALCVGCWVGVGGGWAESTVNGDFEASSGVGDAGFGWSDSGSNPGSPPPAATPLISIEETVDAGGNVTNRFARFESGEVASSPLISTLEQSFTVSVNAELRFDFSFDFGPDATGTEPSLEKTDPTPAGTFLDAFVVSLGVGTGPTMDVFELLSIDRDGIMLDPFASPATDVELVSALDADFDFGFKADLAALVGQDVTLFFDMISVDDGSQLVFDLDNVGVSGTGGSDPGGSGSPVPEPGTLGLLGLGLLGCLGYRRWGQKYG